MDKDETERGAFMGAREQLAQRTFKTIFGLELEGGNRYWELIDTL